MAPLFGHAGRVHHHDAVGVLDGGETVGDDQGGAALGQFEQARWIARSVSVSSAEVASSKIRIGGFFRNMRAIARRCF